MKDSSLVGLKKEQESRLRMREMGVAHLVVGVLEYHAIESKHQKSELFLAWDQINSVIYFVQKDKPVHTLHWETENLQLASN